MNELIALETQGWRELASPDGAGRRFYRSVLADAAVMLFPGGMMLSGKEAILASIGDQPWDDFAIEDERALMFGEACGAVVYRVTAASGEHQYVALISSTYAQRNGRWQLVLHQQTPV